MNKKHVLFGLLLSWCFPIDCIEQCEWTQFLSNESRVLCQELFVFLENNKIDIDIVPLPQEVVTSVSVSFKNANTPIERAQADDTIFLPTFLIDLHDSILKKQEVRSFTMESLLTYEYIVYDFMQLLKKHYGEPNLSNIFMEHLATMHKATIDQKSLDAIRLTVDNIIKRKSTPSLSEKAMINMAIDLFLTLYTFTVSTKSIFEGLEIEEYGWPQWIKNILETDLSALMKITGVRLSIPPGPLTFDLIRNFPENRIYTLPAYTSIAKAIPFVLTSNQQYTGYSESAIKALFRRVITLLNMEKFTQNYRPRGPQQITFLGVDLRKIMPSVISKEKPIAGSSINSAETSRELQAIAIVRNEEASKVLLHELLHLFQVDKFIPSLAPSFAMDGSMNLNECVIEAIACSLNVICTALEFYEKNKQCDLEVVMDQMWKLERKFGMYQAAKLLVAAGFKNFEDFCNRASPIRLQQTTSAAEYYVLKVILLQNQQEFYNIFFESYYKEHGSRTFMEKLIKLMQSNIKQIVPIMNYLMNTIRSIGRHGKLGETGRFTIIEPYL